MTTFIPADPKHVQIDLPISITAYQGYWWTPFLGVARVIGLLILWFIAFGYAGGLCHQRFIIIEACGVLCWAVSHITSHVRLAF